MTKCKHCSKEFEGSGKFCSGKCQKEYNLDKKYWFQDWINIARELGISKREFLEDHYPDETILLFKRKAVMDKRRNERLDIDKTKDEEVYWDQLNFGR